MGSGKTTVGRLLAERLGRPFLDSDDLIEARTGRTVREIFASDGEAAFRALESDVLDEALSSRPPAVVAAAGGTVLAESNRTRLAVGGTVVWLRAAPAALVERVAGGEHRPLLDDDPAAVLAQMAVDREALYREVADVTVEVEGRAPDAIADDIVAAVAGARR
jgi:shikimate kinase